MEFPIRSADCVRNSGRQPQRSRLGSRKGHRKSRLRWLSGLSRIADRSCFATHSTAGAERMQAAWDELGIELLKYGYRRVRFIELECRTDGTLRIGVSSEVALNGHFECPRCHLSRPSSGILATGYTRRTVPFVNNGAAHYYDSSDTSGASALPFCSLPVVTVTRLLGGLNYETAFPLTRASANDNIGPLARHL